jgi:hypothetical protein
LTQGGGKSGKVSERNKSIERPEGQAKTIQCQESGAFVKPSHGEYRKVRGKVDRNLRGNREDEA